MKNCLVQKLYGFKEGKIWRINFLSMLKNFEISKKFINFIIILSFNWIM